MLVSSPVLTLHTSVPNSQKGWTKGREMIQFKTIKSIYIYNSSFRVSICILSISTVHALCKGCVRVLLHYHDPWEWQMAISRVHEYSKCSCPDAVWAGARLCFHARPSWQLGSNKEGRWLCNSLIFVCFLFLVSEPKIKPTLQYSSSQTSFFQPIRQILLQTFILELLYSVNSKKGLKLPHFLSDNQTVIVVFHRNDMFMNALHMNVPYSTMPVLWDKGITNKYCWLLISL